MQGRTDAMLAEIKKELEGKRSIIDGLDNMYALKVFIHFHPKELFPKKVNLQMDCEKQMGRG